MRNILIHDYDDVNLNVVWKTAEKDLPPLIIRLEAYLAASPPEDSRDGSSSQPT